MIQRNNPKFFGLPGGGSMMLATASTRGTSVYTLKGSMEYVQVWEDGAPS